ncbi:hypothetical protein Sp245p_25895 (plasmid) [Azospirillum baldaniorum]|uniref:Uncharacterized protein n=1 Tax=Azospirillum baldaniorum TaxID=1064539 RepID=A0A9P1JZX1_9PROT|nr:hypothetical protein [Azospirillum baldaniorum]AWJ93259.1 hypothetical protein Sp245p_25895 [Azospirillum baldaniorum]TWA77953.1 hypothetical protein FBZ85_106113 [Azospirillum brasilense]CCD02947.1 protein of unknown function [Azospirillum baldaniorum]
MDEAKIRRAVQLWNEDKDMVDIAKALRVPVSDLGFLITAALKRPAGKWRLKANQMVRDQLTTPTAPR